MADDDDDFDEGLWDAVDQLVQQQQQNKASTTISQAPNATFQQPQANGSTSSNQTRLPQYQPQPQLNAQQQQQPSWRAQPVQQRQLPLAPPPKPASLAQQLGSAALQSQFGRPPAGAYHQHTPVQGYGTAQHPQQQQQQQQHWQQQQQQLWGAAPQQQQAQQSAGIAVSQAPGVAAAGLAGNTASAAAAVGVLGATGMQTGALTGAAVGDASSWQQRQQSNSMQATQPLAPQQLQQQLGQVQQQLQAQANAAADLQRKLAFAEQEKMQLQMRLQQQQQQSQHSIAQLKQNDLQKQMNVLKERLLFAEQEANEAKKRASAKDEYAAQADSKLKELQHEVSKKEELLLQLQHELEQEKQRMQRTAAAGGSTAAAFSLASPAAAAAAAATPGRKRRLSGGVAPAGSGSTQLTPQQQRQQQMQQLLGAKAGRTAAMQQQQQFDTAMEMPEADGCQRDAGIETEHAAPSGLQQHHQQQHSGAVAQPAEPQQPVQPQHQQQQGIVSSLIPTLQQVQITPPQLNQLLWSSCKHAMQQLLQPLHMQFIGMPRKQPLESSTNQMQQQLQQQQQQSVGVPRQIPALLASIQQQLQLLSCSNSSSGVSLALLLLQLAVVLFPANACSDAADATTGQQCKWILQQQQQHPIQETSNSSSSSSNGDLQANCLDALHAQQQQHFLVFQASDNPQVMHVLPLPLAVAVLQLLQGLVLHDHSCLQLFAAGLGAARIPGSYQQLLMRNCQSSRHRSSCSSSSNRAVGRSWYSSANDNAAAVVCWGPIEASISAVLSSSANSNADVITCGTLSADLSAPAAAASMHSGSSSQRPHQRSLLTLLAEAGSWHADLLLHAGTLLAAVASRLPVQLRLLLLLLPPVSNKLLLQLLHADGYDIRCQGAALLQELLMCPAVAAAFAAAVQSANDATGGIAPAEGDADVVMIDAAGDTAAHGATAGVLQPSNNNKSLTTRSKNNTAGSSKSGSAAAAAAGKVLQSEPRQQQHGVKVSEQSAALAAAVPVQPSISSQATFDVLLGLLDCTSSGLEDSIAQYNSSSSNSGLGVGSSQWGCFELQRRSFAVVAQLLHEKQVLLLQLLLDQQFTSGYGLAQRLLVTADAACSAAGGDPFSIAAPEVPTAAAAIQHSTGANVAGVAPGSSNNSSGIAGFNSSSGSICGVRYGWQECLERVRLAHESLLLLRALVASPGPIGVAAMSDLASNSTALRLIMTTRAKLSEWSEALLAASTAHPTAVGSVFAVAGTEAPGASSAAAAAALPLAAWTWPFSSSCGCKGSSNGFTTQASAGSSAGKAAATMSPGTLQLLKARRPTVQACLQELGNSAASVHRRVMIFIRSQETGA